MKLHSFTFISITCLSVSRVGSTPTSTPFPCINEPGWRHWSSGFSCDQIDELNTHEPFDYCKLFGNAKYEGKSIYEACCLCGGSDAQLVAPSVTPSGSPSSIPTRNPSASPTMNPSMSSIPSSMPSETPSSLPTWTPSTVPSSQPSSKPSALPTILPTVIPSNFPSSAPSTCTNEPAWELYGGYGCDIVKSFMDLQFEENGELFDFCEFAENFVHNGKNANDACCICKGYSGNTNNPGSSPSFGPSSAPSAAALVIPDVFLANLDDSTFNEVSVPFCFSLSAGFEFAQNSTMTFTLTAGSTLTSTTSFDFGTSLGQVCTESVLTLNGPMSIDFSAETTSGHFVELSTSVVSGGNTVYVNLFNDDMSAYTGNATITAQSADINTVIAALEIVDGTGTAVFTKIPTRTTIFTGTGENNEVGVKGLIPFFGSVVDIVLEGLNKPSPIENNDFSQGTDGWELPVDLTLVSVSTHEENVGPGSSGSARRSLQGSLENMDLRVDTGPEGLQSVSRTFITDKGVNGIAVRYRFVTSEVPGGWFGSVYNDYFFVTITAASTGETVSEYDSMNALGLAAFDSSGSTAWRQKKLMLSADGEIVQVGVGVANVGDGAFDSTVYVDFVEEMKQSLCIYSSVAEDNFMTPALQAAYGQSLPGLTAGHAALMLVDTSTNPVTKTTYGLWPDNIPGLDNGSGSDIRVDFAGDTWSEPDYPYMFCHPLTATERQTLDTFVATPQHWTCTNTCASFASETFYAVTGIDIDADEFLGFETPREIGEHIIGENGGSNLSPLPWEDNRRKLQGGPSFVGGLVSSFTAHWLSTCYP